MRVEKNRSVKMGFLKRKYSTIAGQRLGLCLGALVTAALLVFGCGESDSDAQSRNDYLVRVGNRIATQHEFETAMEMAMAGVSVQADDSRERSKRFKLLVLRRMIDELMLLERAGELGIVVSDVELEQALADLKKDLPEAVFGQVLLENAVSLKGWKQRLRIRMTLEKLVEKDLLEQIQISPEEIARGCDWLLEEHPGFESPADPENPGQPTETAGERVAACLRRKKAEAAYASWLENIQKRYTVEVNRARWIDIAGADTLPLIDGFVPGKAQKTKADALSPAP